MEAVPVEESCRLGKTYDMNEQRRWWAQVVAARRERRETCRAGDDDWKWSDGTWRQGGT